jgi:hypothetical protein
MNKQEKREVPSYYAIIPAEVRYCKEIPFGARLLFGEIMALANKSGYCWASNDYFGELYDVHQTTISEWIAVLDKFGFIKSTVNGMNRKVSVLATIRKKPYLDKENSLPKDKEKDLHNNTSSNNKINNIEVSETQPLTETFNSEQYFKGLLKSSNLPLSIIAYYTLKRNNHLNVSNKEQASAVISRNIKVARRLAVFEKSKISKAIDECQNMEIKGQPISYTLETVERFLLK